ncbi:MAG TPA: hypothetical protein VIH21_04250 [Dehalococcoidia bacterium]|jgi:hypothetical protein
MVSRITVVRVERPNANQVGDRVAPPYDARQAFSVWVFGAPTVALLAGLAAEWLDFRALRYPLLLLVGLGVLSTALTLFRRDGARPLLATVVLGAVTWAAAESLYVALHAARGEAFDAARFGPQWSQALGLIGVHGLFLGVPTGIAAALVLAASQRMRRRA